MFVLKHVIGKYEIQRGNTGAVSPRQILDGRALWAVSPSVEHLLELLSCTVYSSKNVCSVVSTHDS